MPSSSRAWTTSAVCGLAHHLGGGACRTAGIHAVALVHRRQLGGLELGVVLQLASLDVELALDEVVLGRDADPLPGRHRDRTRDGSGDAGQAHDRRVDAGRGEPEQQ